MRVLRVLKRAGWRMARLALEVPVRTERRGGAWRVACVRSLARGRWYLLDVELRGDPGRPVYEGIMHAEDGDIDFHARFEGARAKTFLYCERAVRALSLQAPAGAPPLASLRVVRVPRRLALQRVLPHVREFAGAPSASRWQAILAARPRSADAAFFGAWLAVARRAYYPHAATPSPARVSAAAPAPRRARTGSARRALCIDQFLPKPDRDAGSYAALQEMRLLQALGYQVGFFATEPSDGEARPLEEMDVEVRVAAADPAELLHGVELVYLTRHYVASAWIEQVRRHAPGAKLVLNLADLHFLRQEREAEVLQDAALARHAAQVRRAELDAIARVDQVLCYSQAEIDLLRQCGVPTERLSRCPWVVEVPARVPDHAARSGLAFLGGYAHPPNLDAALHLALEIMPRLVRRRPGLTLRLYGSGMPPEVRAVQGAGVEALGYIDDVAAVYDACRVFVAPLRFGAGLKGKVATALARGTPSVLSPVAAEGLDLSGSEAAVAESPEQWVERILAYYDDEALWRATSHAARDFARRNFSFARGLELMALALRRAGLPQR